MVGNLYDDPAYSAKRDSAFSIFYMAINIGAMFAPSMATWITNHFLAQDGLTYNGQIPALAHQYLEMGANMPAEPLAELQRLAAAVGGNAADLTAFSSHYIEKLSSAYNMGFAVACVSVDRLLHHLHCLPQDLQARRRYGPAAGRQRAAAQVELTPAQTKSRITALMLVFAVVIFFWMAFHQNGSTMTFFARDYTTSEATGITRMSFDILNLVLVLVGVYGLVGFFQSEKRAAASSSAPQPSSWPSLHSTTAGPSPPRPGTHPAAGIPAVQPLLRRGPHAAVGGPLRLARPQGQGALGSPARSAWAW